MTLDFVTLIPPPNIGDIPGLGLPVLKWRGEALTFATIGPIVLEMQEDGLTVAVVRIPVLVEMAEPATVESGR